MGFEVKDQKAGLGVSLFSEEKSLIEHYGKASLDRANKKDDQLRHYFWGLRDRIELGPQA